MRSRWQPPGQNSLEGVLFPDTYLLTDKEDETGHRPPSRRPLRRGRRRGRARPRPPPRPGSSPYQLVVAASLVETEAKVEEDRPLIASVIQNRLQKGMRLQIDATVLYALGKHKNRVLYKDLEVDTPYNTYRIDGLPPTPIAAVGKASLEAMLHPADTTYIYYVLSDKNGKHAFATTVGRVRGPESRGPPQRVSSDGVSSDRAPRGHPAPGHTRVVGVIGDPVAHSLSPTLHNAAFAALGLDWVYVAFPVPRGRGADAVAAVPALGLAGFNVTMPHKEDVASACDELTPDAAALASVNTVVARPDGRTLGDSTDGPGFLDALAGDAIAVGGRPVLVLGAGGAARAVVLALGRAGADVTVAARRPDAAEAAAALAPGARAVPLGAADPSDFAVVVNATPLGMSGGDPLPVDPQSLHARPGGGRPRLPPRRHAAPDRRPGPGGGGRQRPGHAAPPGRPVVRAVDRPGGAGRRHAGGRDRRGSPHTLQGYFERALARRATTAPRSRPSASGSDASSATASVGSAAAGSASASRPGAVSRPAFGAGAGVPVTRSPGSCPAAASGRRRHGRRRGRRLGGVDLHQPGLDQAAEHLADAELAAVEHPDEGADPAPAVDAGDDPPLGGVEGDRAGSPGVGARGLGDQPGPGLDRRDDGDDLPPFGHAAIGLRQQPGDVDGPVRRPRRPPVGLELERSLGVAEQLEADVVEPLEQVAAGLCGRRAGLAAGLAGAHLPAGEPQHALAGLGPDVQRTGLVRPRQQLAELGEAEGIESSLKRHGGFLPFRGLLRLSAGVSGG